MKLEDMANLMRHEISKMAGRVVQKPFRRTTAADLLRELAKENDFDEADNSCNYKGSIDNQAVVIDALRKKYGDDVAEDYIPSVNVRPKTKWLQEGYCIKRGEKPLCFIHTWHDSVMWTIPVWHKLQVELNI